MAVHHSKVSTSQARPRGTAQDASRLAALYQHHQRLGAVPRPTAEAVAAFLRAELLDAMPPSALERMGQRVLARLVG